MPLILEEGKYMARDDIVLAKAKKLVAQREAYRDLMKMKDYFHLCYGKKRQEELDKSLMELATKGAFVSPLNVDRVEIEKRITRLMIAAGANPNIERMGLLKPESVFETFMQFRDLKPHCALEIVKADGFKRPVNLDHVFLRLEDLLEQHIKYGKAVWNDYHETIDEFEHRKKLCSYGQALVYTLFEKGMRPKNKEVLKNLQPIYEAEKKRLAQATPTKIVVPKKIKHGDEAMEFIGKLERAYEISKNSKLVFGPGSFPRDTRRPQTARKMPTRSERS